MYFIYTNFMLGYVTSYFCSSFMLIQGENPAEHPRELLHLVNTSYLFKVQINKDNIEDPEETNFHVQKICRDENIIETFLNKYHMQAKVRTEKQIFQYYFSISPTISTFQLLYTCLTYAGT